MWVWMLHSWPLPCGVPFSKMGVGEIDLLSSSKWRKRVVRKWSFYNHLDILTSVYGWFCQQKFHYLHIGAFYTDHIFKNIVFYYPCNNMTQCFTGLNFINPAYWIKVDMEETDNSGISDKNLGVGEKVFYFSFYSFSQCLTFFFKLGLCISCCF